MTHTTAQGGTMPIGRHRKTKPQSAPYALQVNGHDWTTGTLQEIQTHIADLVTIRVAADPDGFAPDAQGLNRAFTNGAVQAALDLDHTWYTVLGAHTEEPLRLRITAREA